MRNIIFKIISATLAVVLLLPEHVLALDIAAGASNLIPQLRIAQPAETKDKETMVEWARVGAAARAAQALKLQLSAHTLKDLLEMDEAARGEEARLPGAREEIHEITTITEETSGRITAIAIVKKGRDGALRTTNYSFSRQSERAKLMELIDGTKIYVQSSEGVKHREPESRQLSGSGQEKVFVGQPASAFPETTEKSGSYVVRPLTRDLAEQHKSRLVWLHNKIMHTSWTEKEFMAERWPKGERGRTEDRVFVGKWEHSYVALNNKGMPVGYILAYERKGGEIAGVPEPTLYIHGISVDPEWKRKGIGGHLLSEAARKLDEQGFMGFRAHRGPLYLTLQVNAGNPDAIKLYERAGFVRIGDKDLGEGLTDLIYRASADDVVKSISPSVRAERRTGHPGLTGQDGVKDQYFDLYSEHGLGNILVVKRNNVRGLSKEFVSLRMKELGQLTPMEKTQVAVIFRKWLSEDPEIGHILSVRAYLSRLEGTPPPEGYSFDKLYLALSDPAINGTDTIGVESFVEFTNGPDKKSVTCWENAPHNTDIFLERWRIFSGDMSNKPAGKHRGFLGAGRQLLWRAIQKEFLEMGGEMFEFQVGATAVLKEEGVEIEEGPQGFWSKKYTRVEIQELLTKAEQRTRKILEDAAGKRKNTPEAISARMFLDLLPRGRDNKDTRPVRDEASERSVSVMGIPHKYVGVNGERFLKMFFEETGSEPGRDVYLLADFIDKSLPLIIQAYKNLDREGTYQHIGPCGDVAGAITLFLRDMGIRVSHAMNESGSHYFVLAELQAANGGKFIWVIDHTADQFVDGSIAKHVQVLPVIMPRAIVPGLPKEAAATYKNEDDETYVPVFKYAPESMLKIYRLLSRELQAFKEFKDWNRTEKPLALNLKPANTAKTEFSGEGKPLRPSLPGQEEEFIRAIKFTERLKLIRAKQQTRAKFIAIDTSWIKGYEKSGAQGQFEALNPLIIAIRRYCARNKIQIAIGDQETILYSVAKLKKGDPHARGIVLAAESTLDRLDMDEDENVLLAGVDNSKLTEQSYIRIIEMLTLSIDLLMAENVSEEYINKTHPQLGFRRQKGSRTRISFEPDAEKQEMTIQDLKALYRVQIAA